MREQTQASEAEHLQGNLLKTAVQPTMQLLETRAETTIQCDLSPYFERIFRSQRWVAKEVTALGSRLRQARQGEVMRMPRVVSDAPVPFQITELRTRQACRVRDSWGYPWEVEIEGITFVVEVDGSIVTFLEGFPDSVIERAMSALTQLASDLYIQIQDNQTFPT